MKVILSYVIILTNILTASDYVEHKFNGGDVIKASEINGNFDFLSAKITELRNKLSISESKQFIGISTTSHDGDDGILGMNNACHNTFENSRMCTSKDIINSTNINLLGSSEVWVHPTEMLLIGLNTKMDLKSGFNSGGDDEGFSCNGWSRNTDINYHGLVISLPKGSFSIKYCDSLLKVSCCK